MENKKTYPLVSIIIPSYGGGQYLSRSLDSVLLQTYHNIECIVVDDNGAGTPNQLATAQIMNKYLKYANIKYIVHPINKNGSAARNTGFKNSHGDYICLLDDDDEYYPEKIERQVYALENAGDNYGLAYCSVEVYSEQKGSKIRHARESKDYLLELLLHSVIIGSSSLMIRRSIWEQLDGFDESFRRHQDHEFTARIASVTKILPLDFIGFKYYLYHRNSPCNYRIALQYKNHYIEKMDYLMQKYPQNIVKEIIAENKIRLAMEAFNSHNYCDAIKIFYNTEIGIFKYKYLFRQLINKFK